MVSNSKRSKKRSLISVCIANYNGQDVIDACIKSVLSQDSGCEIEVIVHDDASTDESKAIVECGYPSVILIESRENVGFCVSTNRMVARARGDYLLLLNNDAELMPGAIEALMQAAELSIRQRGLGRDDSYC